MNKKFVCCFCGKNIKKKDMIILDIHLDFEEETCQQLYSHRKCLRSKILKDIPTIFEDEE